MINARIALFTAITVGTLALAARASDVEQKVGNGVLDWAAGTIRVTGGGAPPAQGSQAQLRIMAKRAAQVDAYRQLAEVVNGVQVTSETVVKDFVTESDTIRTRVRAVIKGAVAVGSRNLSDGSVEVDVRMPMFGKNSLADAVDLAAVVERERQKPVPAAALGAWRLASADLGRWLLPGGGLADAGSAEQPPVLLAQAGTPVTGLIVDAAELGAEPAMGPVLIGGPRRVYPGGKTKIDKSLLVARGVVHYADTVEDARKDIDRVGANPLLVRAKAAVGRSHSDILIDDGSARQIIEADQRFGFLQELRVALVL